MNNPSLSIWHMVKQKAKGHLYVCFPSLWSLLNRNAVTEQGHWLEDKTSSCKGGPKTLACSYPPPAGKIIPDKQQQGNVEQISLTDEP